MNLAVILRAWAAFSGAGLLATAEVPLQLVHAPALSSDGSRLAFVWCGDIWTAPGTGGEAVRVVDHPAREATPQFTPDGQRIVFSSERTGSMQVFSIPSGGGEAIQHSHHSEGSELECLSPDGTRAWVKGIRARSGFRETRLMEIDLTRDRRELEVFDASAHSASSSPDGTRILFCRGGEQLYRKGFKGSRASQIWEYDLAAKRFEMRVAGETEARSPVWHPDGSQFYYISGRDGVNNVRRWSANADEPVTRFEEDGVVAFALSADGSAMVVRRGFHLYRIEADGAPRRMDLWTREPLPDVSRFTTRIRGTSDVDFSPGLESTVFSAAGDLWHDQQRLTQTPESETDVRFSPAGDWLYFLRDDGVEANYFRARWANGKLGEEQAVTQGRRSKTRLKQSADGSRIAWVEGTGEVLSADADGGNVARILPGWDLPVIDLSPDGRWLAIAAKDANSNRDIWFAASDGRGEPVNLTAIPGYEGSPRWSPDGTKLAYTSRSDAAAPLELRWIDFGKSGPGKEVSATQLRKAAASSRVVSTRGIEPTRLIWSADSKSLLYQSANSANPKLYSVNLETRETTPLIGQRGIPIRMTPDGVLLWRVGRAPATLIDGKLTRFPIDLTVDRSREETLALGFRRIWRTLGERFYDPTMNGRDWPRLLEIYQPLAAGARDSRQFDRLVSQLFGELNASHLSFLREPWPGETVNVPKEEPTAHPGMEFRNDRADGPLVVRRVTAGSPVAGKVIPGETVVRIAGDPVTNFSPLHRHFKGAADRPLPVIVRSEDGEERVIELRGISYAQARALDAREREDRSQRLAGGDQGICYLAVPDMNRATIAEIERKVYQSSLECDGLVLDLRDNGGGREADRLLALFTQPRHSFTIPRDGPRGYPYDRLPQAAWHKPLVVICNEGTFSNAEIFCHAILQTGRAALVGTATAGGVISAVKSTIPDVGELQVPFRGWFHAQTGANLDLNGAKPDHPVPLTPADEAAGRDPQLEKALELVRDSISRKEADPPPNIR